jgi:hypothetical protein
MDVESKQTSTFFVVRRVPLESRLRLRPGTDRGDIRDRLASRWPVLEGLSDGDAEPEDHGKNHEPDHPTQDRGSATPCAADL